MLLYTSLIQIKKPEDFSSDFLYLKLFDFFD